MRILIVDEYIEIVNKALAEVGDQLSSPFYHGVKTILASIERMSINAEIVEDESGDVGLPGLDCPSK